MGRGTGVVAVGFSGVMGARRGLSAHALRRRDEDEAQEAQRAFESILSEAVCDSPIPGRPQARLTRTFVEGGVGLPPGAREEWVRMVVALLRHGHFGQLPQLLSERSRLHVEAQEALRACVAASLGSDAHLPLSVGRRLSGTLLERVLDASALESPEAALTAHGPLIASLADFHRARGLGPDWAPLLLWLSTQPEELLAHHGPLVSALEGAVRNPLRANGLKRWHAHDLGQMEAAMDGVPSESEHLAFLRGRRPWFARAATTLP
jgi:hypothetical protein